MIANVLAPAPDYMQEGGEPSPADPPAPDPEEWTRWLTMITSDVAYGDATAVASTAGSVTTLTLAPPADRSEWQLLKPELAMHCPRARGMAPLCDGPSDEMRLVLTAAGWPLEWHEAALTVSWGESRWSPEAIGDRGTAYGLFQLHPDPWAVYCEIPAEWLLEPVANARCALAVIRYELAKGYPMWSNWTVKP
jgi:hypothetical protein